MALHRSRFFTGLLVVIGVTSTVMMMTFLHAPAMGASERLTTASHLVEEGDRLATDGREREALERFLAAHVTLQRLLFDSFVGALYRSMQGEAGDETPMSGEVADAATLRNLNLSKLWIVLDPDDRAFELNLERERAQVIRQFPSFKTPESANGLEAFLHRLYPEDISGERQMNALRDGTLPSSKRWERLDHAQRAP